MNGACSDPAEESLRDWQEATKPPTQNRDFKMTVPRKIKGKWGREEGEMLGSHLQNRITGSATMAVFKVIFLISLSVSPHNVKKKKKKGKCKKNFIENL